MIKFSLQAEGRANPVLHIWDRIESNTRKPVECAFSIPKHKFAIVCTGIQMLSEDAIARLLFACVIIHNMCTGEDFINKDLPPQNEEMRSDKEPAETLA